MNGKAAPACSLSSGTLILVNPQHPCQQTPFPNTLAPAGGADRTVLLDRRAASLLDRLMRDIRGWNGITVVSGWRSRKEQQDIWEESLKDHGEAFTRRFVAIPGHSEHQTGLAVDLGLKKGPVDFIRPAFPYTGLCQTFRAQAAKYGFIQRYPAGKESVTGIAHEPWHFRYVGMPHAEIITGRGLTLEEYLAFLRSYTADRPFYFEKAGHRFKLFYHAAEAGQEPLRADTTAYWMLSGNNVDGYIVTAWGKGDDGHDPS